MSTRSDIIVHCTDNKWRRVYCHWDGYLTHNGRILFDHYTDRVIATKLVMRGDMSSLGASCEATGPWACNRPRTDPRSIYTPKSRVRRKFAGKCHYYADRDDEYCHETNVEPEVGDSLMEVWPPDNTWTEYTYVFANHDDGRGFCWWVGDPDEGTQTLVDLGEALQGKKTIRSNIKMFGGIILGRHGAIDPNDDPRSAANR